MGWIEKNKMNQLESNSKSETLNQTRNLIRCEIKMKKLPHFKLKCSIAAKSNILQSQLQLSTIGEENQNSTCLSSCSRVWLRKFAVAPFFSSVHSILNNQSSFFLASTFGIVSILKLFHIGMDLEVISSWVFFSVLSN